MTNAITRARQRVEGDPEFIDLIDTNYHRCGFHYETEALAAIAEEYFGAPDRHPYAPDPQGIPTAREAIAAYYCALGVSCSPEQLIVTAGSSESYSLIFTTLAAPGSNLLLPNPTYPLFEQLAARANLQVRTYDQREEAEWRPDLAQIEQLVDERTALIVLISPNNPTGAIAERRSLERVLDLAAARGVAVVVDEVFSNVVFDPDSQPMIHAATLDHDARLITINGASKLFAAPDLKLSWMLVGGAQRNSAVQELANANDLYLSASMLSQAMLPALFETLPQMSAQLLHELGHRRRQLAGISDSIEGLSAHLPAGGIHATLRVDPGRCPLTDEQLVVELLRTQKVGLHPGYLYGFSDDQHLVASLLPPLDRFVEGWERVGGYLRRF